MSKRGMVAVVAVVVLSGIVWVYGYAVGDAFHAIVHMVHGY